jgi:hypothetical protein
VPSSHTTGDDLASSSTFAPNLETGDFVALVE